jgi:hypothetical protein
MSRDIKYLGVPNISFSLIDKVDDREELYSKQRIERGFDDSELWSLDSTIAKFIAPRLEEYIKQYPFSDDCYFINECKEFLEAMKMCASGETIVMNAQDMKKYQEKLDLFPKIFKGLWT